MGKGINGYIMCCKGVNGYILWAKGLTDISCTNYYIMKELHDTIRALSFYYFYG